jgi:hypothetical protein
VSKVLIYGNHFRTPICDHRSDITILTNKTKCLLLFPLLLSHFHFISINGQNDSDHFSLPRVCTIQKYHTMRIILAFLLISFVISEYMTCNYIESICSAYTSVKRHVMDPNSYGMFTFCMKCMCLLENGEL